MSRASIVDASALPVHHNGRDAPLYWGMWGMILIEAIVFGSLIASYLYLRLVSLEWPPGGVHPPELGHATINTIILLVSAGFVNVADRGIRRGDTARLKIGLSVGLLLALAFLVVKVDEYKDVGYQWHSHAYGSAVWTLTGFHTLHVIALILKTIVMLFLAFRGYFNAERNLGVQINGLYWYFVVAAWLPIYVTLYFVPRGFG